MLLTAFLPRTGALPASPRHPDKPRRPPPRRRGGEPTTAPQSPIPRAHEHYKHPRKLFLSLFRSFPNRRPRNTTAAIRRTPVSLTPPSTRLSAASPPSPTPPLALPRLREASRPLLFAQSSQERRLRRSPPPPTRLLRRAAASEPLPAPLDHPAVRLEPVKLPHPSTLAGKRPVKPRLPSLTRPRDLGLKEKKTQGVI